MAKRSKGTKNTKPNPTRRTRSVLPPFDIVHADMADILSFCAWLPHKSLAYYQIWAETDPRVSLLAVAACISRAGLVDVPDDRFDAHRILAGYLHWAETDPRAPYLAIAARIAREGLVEFTEGDLDEHKGNLTGASPVPSWDHSPSPRLGAATTAASTAETVPPPRL